MQKSHLEPRSSYPTYSQNTVKIQASIQNPAHESHKLSHARGMTPNIVKTTIVENMLQSNKSMMTTSNLKKIKMVFKKQPLNKNGQIKLCNLGPVWDAISDLTTHPQLTHTEMTQFLMANKLDPEKLIGWKDFKKQLKRFSDPDKHSGKQQSCVKSIF